MRREFSLTLFMLCLLCFFCHPCCSITGQIEAEEALAEAENQVISAYIAVKMADGAGANTSNLMDRLESAGNLLAEANNAYRAGDYEKAYSLAITCRSTLKDLVNEASILKLNGEQAYLQKLRSTAGLSTFGLILLGVLGFIIWRFLRKSYLNRVLTMKPKLEEAETHEL